MSAYYNEHDPFAAAWLRELIADNLIAPGEVDERSIEDVTPDDLRPFQQCHFFAGIGIWSLAARRAGIPDSAPLWTGSCPCQPFSAAGKGEGFDDIRHLWPAFHYLIEQCRPALVVGEQVAGADGDTWFDLVSADLDATSYAFGVAETVAAGFGAPHKRTRNYWLAYPRREGREEQRGRWIEPPRSAEDSVSHGLVNDTSGGRGEERPHLGGVAVGNRAEGRAAGLGDGRGADGLADANGERSDCRGAAGGSEAGPGTGDARNDTDGGVADADTGRRGGIAHVSGGEHHGPAAGRIENDGRLEYGGSFRGVGHNGGPGPTNGLWADPDWLLCRDEKWRPVEPGTFPLADAGAFRNRVGLLRGAGNAITLGQAEGFLRAVIASIR